MWCRVGWMNLSPQTASKRLFLIYHALLQEKNDAFYEPPTQHVNIELGDFKARVEAHRLLRGPIYNCLQYQIRAQESASSELAVFRSKNTKPKRACCNRRTICTQFWQQGCGLVSVHHRTLVNKHKQGSNLKSCLFSDE